MVRPLLLLSVLAAACAAPAPRVLKAPGLELTVRDGRWSLLVVFAGDGSDVPRVVFEEGGDPLKAPPTARVRLPKSGFDARALPPAKGRPDSYHEMVAGNRARGVRFLLQKERGHAYPLMWWGLGEDPGLDGASPAAAFARIGELFPEKP